MPRIRRYRAALAVLLVSLVACGPAPVESPALELEFDLSGGSLGWVATFSDYPEGDSAFFELASGHRQLPAPLDARSGIFISGNNHSDDLFMYLKRQVGGLEPNTAYRVSFLVEFATDVPAGCAGVGGQPGESVAVKAGASDVEPTSVVEDGWLRMNIDKGDQGTGGANAVVIGNVANSTLCEQNIRRFEIKQLRTPQPVSVITDNAGFAWLLVGTDSGFEAVTSLYYTRVTVAFRRS